MTVSDKREFSLQEELSRTVLKALLNLLLYWVFYGGLLYY